MKVSRLIFLALLSATSGCSRCSGPSGTAQTVPFRLESTFNTNGSGIGGAPVSSRFVLQRPHHLADGEKPGLLLWFHADGLATSGWDDKATLRQLARTGDRFKLVTVVIREPHAGSWAAGRVGEDVKFVDDFVETYALKTFDIDTRRIFYAGAGGGEQFATKTLPAQSTAKDRGTPLASTSAPDWLDEALLKATPPRSY